MATASEARVSYLTLQNRFEALEAECQAEEAVLQAATLRDRAFLEEFDKRTLKIEQELLAIQQQAEEFTFDMDCKQSLQQHAQGFPIRSRVEFIVVSTSPSRSLLRTNPMGRKDSPMKRASTRRYLAPLTLRTSDDAEARGRQK